jgi:hypothetical protein
MRYHSFHEGLIAGMLPFDIVPVWVQPMIHKGNADVWTPSGRVIKFRSRSQVAEALLLDNSRGIKDWFDIGRLNICLASRSSFRI